MNVVPLRPAKPCDDIAGSLRRLADDIEADSDHPITTCVVVMGHTDAETNPDENGSCYASTYWRVHGYGPRTDTFTVRGLLASATREWDSE